MWPVCSGPEESSLAWPGVGQSAVNTLTLPVSPQRAQPGPVTGQLKGYRDYSTVLISVWVRGRPAQPKEKQGDIFCLGVVA